MKSMTPELKWTCYEELGSPIYKGEPADLENLDGFLVDENKIFEEDGLHEGMKITVPTVFGWTVATVKPCGIDGWVGHTEACVYFLIFEESGINRVKCWKCFGSGSLKGIQKLKL